MTTKIIRIYLHFSLLLALGHSFFFATYQIFLVRHGLSLMQINLINVSFMTSNFCLQVPTGAVADLWGRRRSVAIGCFILSLSFLIYYFSGSFAAFIAAEIVGALGSTLISGALDAWMVDSLEFHGHSGSQQKIFENQAGYSTVGTIISSLAGAWAGNYDIALPWLLTAIAMAGVGIYAWFKLEESYFQTAEPSTPAANLRKIKKTSLEGIRFGLSHKSVQYAIGFGTILTCCCQGFNMQWPLVFKGYGFSVGQLGFIFTGISVLNFAGGKLSRRCGRYFKKEKDALIFGQAITVIGMLIAASMTGLAPVLTGFLLHEIGRGLFKPQKQVYLNKRIPTDKRATVLSFDSMINQAGNTGGLLLSGYLADSFSIGISWLVSGIILGAGIIIFRKLKNGD